MRGEPVDLADVAREAAATDRRRPSVVAGAAVMVTRRARPRSTAPPSTSSRNARRHGPAGGRITVTAARAGDRAALSVADEGPGLGRRGGARTPSSASGAARGARGEGSGLGLAIVRAIAERHGGRAAVEGSRFTIDLPALAEGGGAPGGGGGGPEAGSQSSLQDRP